MSCSDCPDPSVTCGEKVFAPCVHWEIPDSLITSRTSVNPLGGTSDCVTLDDVLEDIYPRLEQAENEIDSIQLALDFTNFSSNCIDLSSYSNLTLKNVITELDSKLCNLDDVCYFLQKEDINNCNIDYGCFGDDSICGNTLDIKTLEDLLQEMIDRICTLENKH